MILCPISYSLQRSLGNVLRAREGVVAVLTFLINDLRILELLLKDFINRPLITIMSEQVSENKVDSYGFSDEPTSIMISLI